MFSREANFSNDSIFKHAEDVLQRKNPDGSIIVMSIKDEDIFYKVKGVAAEVFASLDGKKQIGQIIEQIQPNYDVTTQQIAKDSETFLKKLLELKLISLC